MYFVILEFRKNWQ